MIYSIQKLASIRAEIQNGATIIETCRKYNISKTTYYNWNNKFATKKASKLKRAKNRNTKPMGLTVEQVLVLNIQALRYSNKMTSCTKITIVLQPSYLT